MIPLRFSEEFSMSNSAYFHAGPHVETRLGDRIGRKYLGGAEGYGIKTEVGVKNAPSYYGRLRKILDNGEKRRRRQ
jgi:hypothetical protein